MCYSQVQRGLSLSQNAAFGSRLVLMGNLHCFLPHGYGWGKLKGLAQLRMAWSHCSVAGTRPGQGKTGQEGNNISCECLAASFAKQPVKKYEAEMRKGKKKSQDIGQNRVSRRFFNILFNVLLQLKS